MVAKRTISNNYDRHVFLSQVAEDIGRYGETDKICPVCGNTFILQRKGSSYVLHCETDNCLKITSRGI